MESSFSWRKAETRKSAKEGKGKMGTKSFIKLVLRGCYSQGDSYEEALENK